MHGVAILAVEGRIALSLVFWPNLDERYGSIREKITGHFTRRDLLLSAAYVPLIRSS
jgi:hypothetical protein